MEVYGCDELQALMRDLAGRVPKQARKIIDRGADKIVKEAQLNAPVDEHNLEESIKKEKSYEDRRRLRVDIVAGGSVNGVNVDQYIMMVHENYESLTPGPGTQAKRAANPGRYVGGKFVDRAVKEMMPRIQAQMIEAIYREMRELK